MAPSPTRVALYLRVSTRDRGQTVENQRRQLRDHCERQGYSVVAEYSDDETGTKGRRARSGFGRLFDAAAKRRFDLVLFWSLDRFSREGIRKTISYLQQLDGYGVRFKSFTEPHLDTDNELVAHILLGVLSYLAGLEARKISDRTKAGLERAKAQGTRLGRRSKFEQYRPEIERMRAEGLSAHRRVKASELSRIEHNLTK